jgi:hypothetical protein
VNYVANQQIARIRWRVILKSVHGKQIWIDWMEFSHDPPQWGNLVIDAPKTHVVEYVISQ